MPTASFVEFGTNKTVPTATKVRGGYYTPAALADYLCRWAIRNRSDRVLEPSCGDGSFVSAAAPLLGDDGSITAVEIVPVQYAAELRDRLPRLFDAVFVIAFDRLVFPDIQQEVLLLLGEGRNRNPQTYGRLYTRQVANGKALLSMARTADLVSHVPERHTHADMKWTSLFLEDDEFRALSDAAESGALDRMGDLAGVDVGIVTGRNSFFVVTEGTAQRLGLDGRAVDVVGRTAALKSIRFTADDLQRYDPPRAGRRGGRRRYALRVDGELAYLRLGRSVRAELRRRRAGTGAAGSGTTVDPVSVLGRHRRRVRRPAPTGRRPRRRAGSRRPRAPQGRMRILRPGRDARRMEQTTIKAPSTKIERRCVGRTCPFSLTNPRHVLSPAQVERRSATVYVYEVSDTRIANG